MAFSLDGERIFAGLAKSLKIFHLSRPGRECISVPLYSELIVILTDTQYGLADYSIVRL